MENFWPTIFLVNLATLEVFQKRMSLTLTLGHSKTFILVF